jgi:uncharacterized protein
MSKSLKINVVTIPEEGLNIDFSGDNKWFQESFTQSDEIGFTLQKVDVVFNITITDGNVFIKCRLFATLCIACSRCLEDVILSVSGDFAYTMEPMKTDTREEVELAPEELETSYYQGDFIDLAPIIYEQIILQIPIKSLCAEDCKGLCFRCGTNLNKVSCDCSLEVIDERLAILKNFEIKH